MSLKILLAQHACSKTEVMCCEIKNETKMQFPNKKIFFTFLTLFFLIYSIFLGLKINKK